MPDIQTHETPTVIATTRPAVIGSIAIVGLLAGMAAWLLTVVISNFLIEPIFCRADANTFSICSQGGVLAGNLASVLVGAGGLLALVRLRAYRPLLIVLMSVIALWGVGGWVGGLSWYEALLWTSLLYGLCYATFAWLTQIRSFVTALIVSVLVIIAARVIPIL